MPETVTASRRGAHHLTAAGGVALTTWAVLLAQVALLVGRPSPYGGAYATDWATYLFYGMTFRGLAVLLLSLPFLAWWFWRFDTPIPERTAHRIHTLQLALLTASVAFDHADGEIMRFMGTHLTVNFLRTYGAVGATQAEVGHSLMDDHGGPLLPVAVLVAGPLAAWWAGVAWRHRRLASGRAWSRQAALAAVGLPLVASLVIYSLPGGRFRRERVQGVVLGFIQETRKGRVVGVRPADLSGLAERYQEAWLTADRGGGWRFSDDTTYPLFRRPEPGRIPAAPVRRWNLIILQLETFRGWNVGALRPDLATPSATPFLDSLARGPGGAYWTRAMSFGPPTISGFMAEHCSIPPHSEFHVTTTFTRTRLDCLPAVLRRHGWHTLMFSASDPDWDNETPWIRQWYDETHYYPEAAEADRFVFRKAAERIRQVASGGSPFAATLISISNHYPFRTREPALDLGPSREPREAIRNTMHYTDDVVRELIEDLSRESWFRRTLVVVVGDHGYNLGEHDGEPGQRNGYRESIWIPLIIAGPHPALPRGPQAGVASLLDVAPTVAELLGVDEATSWMGHSLVGRPAPEPLVGHVRANLLFAERGRWSLVGTPDTSNLHLFDAGSDPLQRHDLAGQYPDTARALARAAVDRQRMFDYLVAVDRIWPGMGSGDSVTHLSTGAGTR